LKWEPNLDVVHVSYTKPRSPVVGPLTYLQSETVDRDRQRRELGAYLGDVRHWEEQNATTYVDVPGLSFWRRSRINQRNNRYVIEGTTWTARLPYWPIATLALVAPGAMGLAVLRTAQAVRRQAKGRCVGCGYDLRGGHLQCPECGRDVNETQADPPDRSRSCPPAN
jgi:hypothetical protein